jgi:hypothetical protein
VTATIRDAIAREEIKLAHLDAERKTALDRIQKLREQLATSKSVIISNQESFSLSPSSKITLFRSLFIGRKDVYPKPWISK